MVTEWLSIITLMTKKYLADVPFIYLFYQGITQKENHLRSQWPGLGHTATYTITGKQKRLQCHIDPSRFTPWDSGAEPAATEKHVE